MNVFKVETGTKQEAFLQELFTDEIAEIWQTYECPDVTKSDEEFENLCDKLQIKSDLADEIHRAYCNGVSSYQMQGFIAGMIYGLGFSGKLD